MEKEDKKIFWEKGCGKYLKSLANIFFKMRFDFFNPMPRCVYGFGANEMVGGFVINENYDDELQKYNKDREKWKKANKRYWKRFIKKQKRIEFIKSLK